MSACFTEANRNRISARLTSRGEGNEYDHGSNDCLQLPTHLFGIQEEDARLSRDHPTKPGPNQVQEACQHDTGGLAYYGLEVKRGQCLACSQGACAQETLTVGRRMLLRKKISMPAMTELMMERLMMVKGLMSSSSNNPLSADPH